MARWMVKGGRRRASGDAGDSCCCCCWGIDMETNNSFKRTRKLINSTAILWLKTTSAIPSGSLATSSLISGRKGWSGYVKVLMRCPTWLILVAYPG